MKLSDLSIDDRIKLLVTQANELGDTVSDVVKGLAIAQAVLESNLLHSPSNLANKYNNLFGIKRKGTNGTVELITTEYYNGKKVTTTGIFGHNKTLVDSFRQYRDLLENGTKDKPDRYEKVLLSVTFREAATQIQQCGYATDPKYTDKLISTYKYLKSKWPNLFLLAI